MSSLLLVLALPRQLDPKEKLTLVTADSRVFRDDLLGLGSQAERNRIVIGDIEGSKVFGKRVYAPATADSGRRHRKRCSCLRRVAPRRKSGHSGATFHLHWIPADNAGNSSYDRAAYLRHHNHMSDHA